MIEAKDDHSKKKEKAKARKAKEYRPLLHLLILTFGPSAY